MRKFAIRFEMSSISSDPQLQVAQHPGGEEHFKRHHHFPGHYDLFREEGAFLFAFALFTAMLTHNYR
jgi:hypothetical protein